MLRGPPKTDAVSLAKTLLLLSLISGELDLNDKIKKAFDYYGINCSENLFLDNYKKIINDYTYLSKRWKNNYR